MPMFTTVRRFLLFEAAAFLTASQIHRGTMVAGFTHRQASTAEGVIGMALLVALLAAWVRLQSTRGIGLAAQGFALVGTLVGVVMIAIGVGPRSVPDVVFHAGLIFLLVTGLVVARASRTSLNSSTAG